MNLEEAVKLLQKNNVTIPYKLLKHVETETYTKNKIKQVWLCSKCMYQYKAHTRLLEVRCAKEHDMIITWDEEFVK